MSVGGNVTGGLREGAEWGSVSKICSRRDSSCHKTSQPSLR